MQPNAATRDDNLLASILVGMWALASGRALPHGVSPAELTKEELIDFWADDYDFGPTSDRYVLR